MTHPTGISGTAVLGALATYGLIAALRRKDAQRQVELLTNAERMEQQIRALEARRMGHTVAHLKGLSYGAADSIGQKLAHSLYPTDEMDKEALLNAATQALTKLPGLLRSAGNAVKGKLAPATKAPAASTAAKGALAPAASAAPAANARRKPLVSKGKLVAGGLAAAGTYTGYKGLQAARDYMMVPSGQSMYGSHGPRLRHNVNEYGYPSL